jgi:pimeloyl-ACP methyl ester carboxylesterase
MDTPRLLLVPEFTEVQWTIKPRLQQWAEVASYDPPGIGDEPPPPEPTQRVLVERGLSELDRLGWERFFVIADGWSIGIGVKIAAERSDSLAGLVLTHASLTHSTEGERPSVSPDVYDALTQLIRQDAPSFVRHGIAQVTGGSVDEDLADRMLERLPTDNMIEGWELLTAPIAYADQLLGLDCPMLLVKHEGCLMSTEEGWEDAVAALPSAEKAVVPDAPPVSDEFAERLRSFCLAHSA